jgi:hypothetical protein
VSSALEPYEYLYILSRKTADTNRPLCFRARAALRSSSQVTASLSARDAGGDHLSDAIICAIVTRRARARRGMTEQGSRVMRLRCLGGFGMLVAFVFFYLAIEEYVSSSTAMKECVPCVACACDASITNPE